MPLSIDDFLDLPGADLMAKGLGDLEHARETVEAALVSAGWPRLGNYDRAVEIEEAWMAAEWPLLLAESGLTEDRTQLVVTQGARPERAAEAAYISPSMGGPARGTYALVTRIGDRVASSHHVIAVWRDLQEHDAVAVSALLRHELEHARQWERWGPPVLEELDAELKSVLRHEGPLRYHETPVERAADDAARSWITARYGQGEADRLAHDVFPHWQEVSMGARDADLRTETIAALRAAAPEGYEVWMSNAPAITVEEFIADQQEWQPTEAMASGSFDTIEFVA